MAKTPEDIRKAAAKRQAEKRKREAAHNKKLGLEQVCVYSQFKGTRACLNQLKKDHGFTQDSEVITLLIHNAANSDLSQQAELLAIPNIKG